MAFGPGLIALLAGGLQWFVIGHCWDRLVVNRSSRHIHVQLVNDLDGTTVLGFEPVNAAGQATVPVSLGIGTHALTASFSGVTGFAASDSAATAVTGACTSANSSFARVSSRSSVPARETLWRFPASRGLQACGASGRFAPRD